MKSILLSFIFKLKMCNFLKKVNLTIELNELLIIIFFYKDVISPRIYVTTRSQSCRYCPLWTQGGPHGFKTRLLGEEEPLHIQHQEHSPLSDVGHHKHPPCRHNVLIVSHGIAGSNRKTPLIGPNKPSHRGRGLALIPFVTTRS